MRLLLAAGLAAAVVGSGAGAMGLTRSPAWISLLLEPFCLLLLPGAVYGMAKAYPHDFHASVVLYAAMVFYFCLFEALLEHRAWKQRRQISQARLKSERR